jgi:hypothetical protein
VSAPLDHGQRRHAPDLCEGVRVEVDSSWADTLPPCCVCKRDVPWEQALLMPCSTVEDGDVDCVGIIHRDGCPS